jgi:hypothetical protein
MAHRILVFFQRSARAANDSANKLRETILTEILDTPHTEDPLYGDRWRKVQGAWKQALHEVSRCPYETVRVTHKGGRANHDFLAEYLNQDHVQSRNLEFKVSKTMKSIPQFLSLYVSFGMFPLLYDHYYYHEHLDKYLNFVGIEKPSYDEWRRELYKSSSSLPFFQTLREKEPDHKKEKEKVVNDSIKEYLEKYGSTFVSNDLYTKLQTSQDKDYLLWDGNQFQVHRLEFGPVEYVGYTKNQILVRSGDTDLRLLLRWKNHKGILGPAWQISVITS